MAKKILAVVFGFVLAPAFISAADYSGLSGAFGNQIVGEPCAVRVYHTDFRFPPEGGQIIQSNGELFFIRTYRPGCANAGAGYPVVVASPSAYNPLNIGTNYYVNPAFMGYSPAPQATPQATYQPAPAPAQNPAPTCF